MWASVQRKRAEGKSNQSGSGLTKGFIGTRRAWGGWQVPGGTGKELI